MVRGHLSLLHRCRTCPLIRLYTPSMGLLDWETSGSSKILGISWKWVVNRADRIKNLELSINFLADFSNMTDVLK